MLLLHSSVAVSGTPALRNIDHTLLKGVRAAVWLPADSAEMHPIDVVVAR